jgi:hypothetical protein
MDGESVIQGSEEWRAIKCGKVSASRVSEVLAKGKGLTRAAYLAEIVVERLTGAFTEGFESADMRRGKELEPQARAGYELFRSVQVETVGFVHHPHIPMAGASPDGRVGEIGLVQFKCPRPHNHMEHLDAETSLPKEYRDQMQWEMACDNREWCDFVSFCPSFPPGMDLCVRRVHRDGAYIAEMEIAVQAFIAEVDAKVAGLKARYG